MPLTIPAKIGQFFGLYPDAQAPFVRQDGTTYMNHYRDKAIADAKANSHKLYQFSSATAFSQISPSYPAETDGFEYALDNIVADVKAVRVNGGTARSLAATTISALKDATRLAANAAGYAVFDVNGTVGADWDISIILNESGVTIEVQDGNNDWSPLIEL